MFGDKRLIRAQKAVMLASDEMIKSQATLIIAQGRELESSRQYIATLERQVTILNKLRELNDATN